MRSLLDSGPGVENNWMVFSFWPDKCVLLYICPLPIDDRSFSKKGHNLLLVNALILHYNPINLRLYRIYFLAGNVFQSRKRWNVLCDISCSTKLPRHSITTSWENWKPKLEEIATHWDIILIPELLQKSGNYWHFPWNTMVFNTLLFHGNLRISNNSQTFAKVQLF